MQSEFCWCSNVAPGEQVDKMSCASGCPGYQSDPCGDVSENLFVYLEMGLHAPSSTLEPSTSTSQSSTSQSSTFSTSAITSATVSAFYTCI